jgi:hypothetical protein
MIRHYLWSTNSCAFFLHARLWVRAAHPAFPAPSPNEGHGIARLGRNSRRENADLCPASLRGVKRRPAVARFASYGALGVRRSVLTRRWKQSSRLPFPSLDCFAGARNDGYRLFENRIRGRTASRRSRASPRNDRGPAQARGADRQRSRPQPAAVAAEAQ